MTSPARDPRAPDLRPLGRELDASLAPVAPDRLARQRARLAAAAPSPSSPPLRRRAPAVALALAALGLVAAAALRARHAPPAPLTATVDGRALAAGAWVAANAAPVTLRFGDGSAVQLAPGAQARVASLDAHGASVTLERGALEVRVHHRADTAWRFTAGPYAVRVTGTSFNLAWEPSTTRFELAMKDGRVTLRGPRCDEGIAVQHRDAVRADVRAGTLTVSDAAALALGPTPQLPIPASPTPQLPIPVAPAVPSRAARVPARPQPLAHAPPADVDDDASAAAMLRRADALRLARDTMAAREALVALRRAHPGTPEAARGAFLLGAQALDATGAPAQAARWFQLALREAPDAPFAADARGRLAQALDAAGDHEAARAAARDVLARDPEGAFAPLARHILAR